MNSNRPVLNAELFDQALEASSLTTKEAALIDFVRYTGVFNELILRKGLSLPAKPPALCMLSDICKKIGKSIPNHFNNIMSWSAEHSPDKISWKPNLVCSIAYNNEGEELSPQAGTTLYHTFAVHKELFTGLSY